MLKIEKTVLVLVDVQGKLATLMYNKEEFFSNVIKLIKGAKALELPIIWNEQLPDKLGPTIPEIRELLSGLAPLDKNTFSCCGNSEFSAKLESTGRKQVLLAGMETHVCVYQTAIDLMSLGYDVYLIADAVSSRTLRNIELGIEAMKNAGAKITCVEMALFEILRKAKGEMFKEIIGIVK